MRIEEVGPYAGMAEMKTGDLVFRRGRITRLTLVKVSGVGLGLFGLNGGMEGFESWSRAAHPPISCDRDDSGSVVVNQQY